MSNIPMFHLDMSAWIEHTIPQSPVSEFLHQLDWNTVYNIEKNQKKFAMLIKERPLLMAHYRVHVASIVQLSSQTHKYDPRLIQEIEKALKTTVLLKIIYQHLDEPDDVARAEIDIAILNRILYRVANPNQKTDIHIPRCSVGLSHRLRTLHLNTNLSRLTAIRIRRLILACMALPSFVASRPFVTQIEGFTAPFFLYLGWLFFLPRFMLNCTTLLKKAFFSQKNDFSFFLKIEAYLNLHRRLYEWWTDTAWLTSGILLCFVLYGSSAIWRPFTVLAVQISDTIMMMTRSFFELRRLFFLKNEYQENIRQQLSEPNPGYLQALEERISFEKKVSYLAITNNVLMSIALLGIIPTFSALHPLIPVLGAVLGVLTTLRFYVYNAKNDSQQPKTDLGLVLKNYETEPLPASTPRPLLINKLAIPTVLVLTPLFFMTYALNPILSAILCISLVVNMAYKVQQPTAIQKNKRNFEQIMGHHFFKPQPIEAPVSSHPTHSQRTAQA
jgi:hypothetical protein